MPNNSLNMIISEFNQISIILEHSKWQKFTCPAEKPKSIARRDES